VAAAAAAYVVATTVRDGSGPNPPAGMRRIAGSEFTMGTNDPHSMPNERPARVVRVNGFWIGEAPVTNQQFRDFVAATGYVTTAEQRPDWE
jgi:formylglycine-generating enzyme required for sulfatase activity